MQNPWFHTEFLIVTDTGIKVHLSKSGEEIIDSRYKQEKKNSIITFPGDRWLCNYDMDSVSYIAFTTYHNYS